MINNEQFNLDPFIFFSAYVVWGILIALQPPFYPMEAEKKGAKPHQVQWNLNLRAFSVAPEFDLKSGLLLSWGFTFT